jgi:hypothetical protein
VMISITSTRTGHVQFYRNPPPPQIIFYIHLSTHPAADSESSAKNLIFSSSGNSNSSGKEGTGPRSEPAGWNKNMWGQTYISKH